MSLAGQNQVRHMYVGLDYPGHANIAALRAGANGALVVLSADGTAVAAGDSFEILSKSNKGTLIASDLVKPGNVTSSRSIAYVAPVKGSSVISGFTMDANTLYTLEIAIKQFGSLSPEDEYLKKAFYKSATGNTTEHIVDGLIQSLGRNFQREEPVVSGVTKLKIVGGAYVDIKDNAYFSFVKLQSGGTASVDTVTVAANTDESGTIGVTLDGEFVISTAFESGVTIANLVIQLAAAINASGAPYVATTTATTCIITSNNTGDEADATIQQTTANYVGDAAATIASTATGADGGTPAWSLTVTEKAQWADLSWVVGQKDRETLDFFVSLAATTVPDVTNIASTPGKGSGRSIANMEWYLKGERNDFYRQASYPHNLQNTYDANDADTYDVVELAYFDIGRDEAKQSKKQITIAMPVSARTEMNLLIADLNTILGAGSIASL